jgi:hypothetical protein
MRTSGRKAATANQKGVSWSTFSYVTVEGLVDVGALPVPTATALSIGISWADGSVASAGTDRA